MVGTIRAALLGAVLLTAGCGEASDRVRRVASPKSEFHFVTQCRHFDACLRDARDICPKGFRKEETSEHELTFWCVGKPDW